jgi:hypothetical protein
VISVFVLLPATEYTERSESSQNDNVLQTSATARQSHNQTRRAERRSALGRAPLAPTRHNKVS